MLMPELTKSSHELKIHLLIEAKNYVSNDLSIDGMLFFSFFFLLPPPIKYLDYPISFVANSPFNGHNAVDPFTEYFIDWETIVVAHNGRLTKTNRVMGKSIGVENQSHCGWAAWAWCWNGELVGHSSIDIETIQP